MCENYFDRIERARAIINRPKKKFGPHRCPICNGTKKMILTTVEHRQLQTRASKHAFKDRCLVCNLDGEVDLFKREDVFGD